MEQDRDSIAAATRVPGDPVTARPIEFVERKGLGHPDTICDGVAEAVSRALCRAYRDRVGRVLHHNVDKVTLIAGAADPAFGGGTVTAPLTLVLGGRATATAGSERVPVHEIATDAAREYLADNFPALPAAAVEVEVRTGEGSADLRELYARDGARANDTSFGVGHAPLSPTERVVRTVEPRIREAVDAVGEDVKVMAVRGEDRLHLTVAAAVVGGRVGSMEAYEAAVAAVREAARDRARAETDLAVSVTVNAADDLDAGVEGVYLTETGLSAEMGDDGAVGRGNRANGLITPQRPMSLEAAAGKNPVTHVGKLYNVLAREAAAAAAERFDAYAAVQVLSEIGAPVTAPAAVDVTTAHEDPEAVLELVREHLGRTGDLTDRLVAGAVDLF
jgi:S-adenosylmethionine synthetase